jgi:hypothetical protein
MSEDCLEGLDNLRDLYLFNKQIDSISELEFRFMKKLVSLYI